MTIKQKISNTQYEIDSNFERQITLLEKMTHLTLLMISGGVSKATATPEFNRLKKEQQELKEKTLRKIEKLNVLKLCIDVCEN